MHIPQKCRVAIIGAGYTAREHIRAFAAVPQTEVAGIHSRTRTRAEALAAEFGVPLVCDSIAELYSKTMADLVVVTVNDPAMKTTGLACFEFPWYVLLEKPPGLTVQEAEALQAGAQSLGRTVRVALNRQSYSVTQAVIREISSHSGRRFVKVQDQENPVGALAAGQPPEVAALWMYSNSIHMVDYFRLLARGEAVAVEPIIPWDPASAPCVVAARITFDSGDIGLYEAVWNCPGPWAVSVTIPGRRWEMRPLEMGTSQALGQRPEPMEPHVWDKEFKPGFRLQAEHAVREALGGHKGLADIGQALKTMQLISRIYPQPWSMP